MTTLGRNVTLGGSLEVYQGKFAGLVAGKRGRYHVSPLFSSFGMLKFGDLYRQQLRVHAWQFWNGRLPENQAAMLGRTGDVHRYGTRSAGSGITCVISRLVVKNRGTQFWCAF